MSYEFLDMGELYDELENLRDISPESDDWLDGDEMDRLAQLDDLDSEIGLSSSVRHEQAVSEEGFTDYARELAEELKADFIEFEFDGKTWLVRA